jgi:hypothetical protein
VSGESSDCDWSGKGDSSAQGYSSASSTGRGNDLCQLRPVRKEEGLICMSSSISMVGLCLMRGSQFLPLVPSYRQ